MFRTITIAILALAFLAPAATAQAHFQMIYTPEAALPEGKKLDLKLVFTHPFEAGHTMNMGKPQEFYVLQKRGEEGRLKKKDLLGDLKPITWESLTNSGDAYAASYKARSMGDYTFVLVPAPYLEKEEDIYIQQISKMMVNVGGIPGNWFEPVGLPCEIVALDKPYALWTGNVFRGVVLSQGKPVPGADIEVEYMNHPPVEGKNKFQKDAMAEAPQDAYVTMTIKTDANGQFAFGIPKAGWWGFCALGVGPDTEFEGKELSQDAVIWVHAVDMK